MDQFDFEVDGHSGMLVKRGHYSGSETREATREEKLLWERVRELEVYFEARRSSRTWELLEKIPKRSGTLTVRRQQGFSFKEDT